jgi:hypothetical protein
MTAGGNTANDKRSGRDAPRTGDTFTASPVHLLHALALRHGPDQGTLVYSHNPSVASEMSE